MAGAYAIYEIMTEYHLARMITQLSNLGWILLRAGADNSRFDWIAAL